MEQTNWKAIQQGNEAAFERMFMAHYKHLCAYANRIIRDEDESENVVQALFCKLWEQRSQIEINIGMKPYLYKAVYFGALNKLKQQSKMKEEVDVSKLQHAEVQVDNLAQVNELHQAVQEAIAALPEKRREIFTLSRFEQKTYKEIASLLNISIKTVENQMGKALETMRLSLADYLPVWGLVWLSPIWNLLQLINT